MELHAIQLPLGNSQRASARSSSSQGQSRQMAPDKLMRLFNGFRFWFEPVKEVVLVNLTSVPIGPAELKTAFAVSENILWYRALMQTLETRRQECCDNAAAATIPNNPLRMAAMVGAADVLGQVIVDLQRLRKKSVSE